MSFLYFISFVILLRLLELAVARRNEKWLLQNGAVEYGKGHYPVMVALHTLFLVALIAEYCCRQNAAFSLPFFVTFLVLISLKVWVIATLGRYWNTKIYRIAHVSLVSRGPYRFVKHPNYIIVVAEIAIIPLVFHLYISAIVFSLLNAAMLYVRIGVENKALALSAE